jgi:chromosome segregation ATPase
MSQNLLPVEDFLEEAGAQGLHTRLQNAFASDEASPQDAAPAFSAIEATGRLAAATLQQGQAFENFQERVVRLEHGPDVGAIRENVRDLCEALLHITVETKKTAAEVDNRFESLADAMAALSGHMASQRQELQANIAATHQLSEQLKQLQGDIAAQRAEAAQIKDLILSTGQTLRSDLEELKDQVAPLKGKLEAQNLQIGAIEAHIAALPGIKSGLASLTVRVDDLEPGAASLANRVEDMEANIAAVTGHVEELESDTASLTDCVTDLEPLKASVAQLAAEDAKLVERFALLADDLDTVKGQAAGLEDTVAVLADSSIRASDGLSVLGTTLETAKTQIFSLNETSEYLTERLRIAERVVENVSRREKILAELHARASRALQTGQ